MSEALTEASLQGLQGRLTFVIEPENKMELASFKRYPYNTSILKLARTTGSLGMLCRNLQIND